MTFLRLIAITPAERARLAVKTLEAVVEEIGSLGRSYPDTMTAELIDRIDEAETQLALEKAKLLPMRVIAQLTGERGRAP